MAEAPANPRNERRQWLVTLAIVTVAVLLVAGWYWTSTSELHKLRVAWAGSPQCSGTTVHDRHFEGRTVVAVAVRPAMSCTLQAQVLNQSRFTVTLNKLILPYLDSGSGTVVKAASVNGVEPRTVPSDSTDAEHLIGRSLAPGRTHTLTVAFGYHEAGCMDAGITGVSEWPWLAASALGRAVVVKGTDTFAVSSSQQIGGGCSD